MRSWQLTAYCGPVTGPQNLTVRLLVCLSICSVKTGDQRAALVDGECSKAHDITAKWPCPIQKASSGGWRRHVTVLRTTNYLRARTWLQQVLVKKKCNLTLCSSLAISNWLPDHWSLYVPAQGFLRKTYKAQ